MNNSNNAAVPRWNGIERRLSGNYPGRTAVVFAKGKREIPEQKEREVREYPCAHPKSARQE